MVFNTLRLTEILNDVIRNLETVQNDSILIDSLISASQSLAQIQSLSLPVPDSFWYGLRDSCKDRTTYEKYRVNLQETWERFLRLYNAQKPILMKVTARSFYDNRIMLEEQKKLSTCHEDAEREYDYVREGCSMIESFSRYYGSVTPAGKEPSGENMRELVRRIQEILVYFHDVRSGYPELIGLYARENKDSRESLVYLYDSARCIVDGMRKRAYSGVQRINTTVAENARERSAEITPLVFEEVFFELNPYFINEYSQAKAKTGPKPTPKTIDSFKSCFVDERDYDAFILVIKDYMKSKKAKKQKTHITAPELCTVYDIALIQNRIKDSVKSFYRFGELFKTDEEVGKFFTTNSWKSNSIRVSHESPFICRVFEIWQKMNN